MNNENRGWFNHSKEHSLASQGIPTKKSDPRTETKTVDTNVVKKTNNLSFDRETERVMELFADVNQKYEISPSVNNNGIKLSEDELLNILKYSIPNGCGTFNNEEFVKLAQLYEPKCKFIIKRDPEDGGVIISVYGTPLTHPGQIKEWVNSSYVTTDENNVFTYKWTSIGVINKNIDKSAKLSHDDRLLLEWSEEVKTRQTDLSFPDWIRSGEIDEER